jgi:hypothetical protein
MIDERRTLVFCVSMALTKGLSLVRGMKQLNEEQRKRVAEFIVHELETTNWKVSLGGPRQTTWLDGPKEPEGYKAVRFQCEGGP